MAPPVICNVCYKEFKKTSNCNRHLREVHQIIVSGKKPNINFRCVICDECCEDYKHFSNHVSEKHGIKIKKEIIEFTDCEEFYNWKNKIENEENCFFSKQRTLQPPKKSLLYTVHFSCNRSGVYKSKVTERKRKLKVQGTSKILGFCPAGIKATFKEDGLVLVDYTSTHVGHNNDLAHLPLKLEQRRDIADKIAMKMSFDEILNEIRSSTKHNSIKREHLITKHDLYNIAREFSLEKEMVYHPNNTLSIDAWVQKERLSENNCVLLYKPQGEVAEEYPALREEDFFLGIMSSAQAEMLINFSSDCVCVDFTHGQNEYDFEITTIMVLDDKRHVFPCAFFISSRTDEESIQIFFNAVKIEVDGMISSNVFMSVMDNSFFNAWESVMGTPNIRLFCSWHVDKDWQENLSKIKDPDEQKMIYKQLKTLLEETDKDAFLQIFTSVTSQFRTNEILEEFGEYFLTYYSCCYDSWAHSYRTNLGVYANIHLERMHKTIKNIFFKGKTIQNLDKVVQSLMQMVKNKLFDRIIVLEKGKITTKLKDLQIRHKQSLKMKSEMICEKGEGCWEVISSSNNEVYTICQESSDCECSTICKDCSACIHKYSCTCIDSCIKWNMCKHIHLVCGYINSHIPSGSHSLLKKLQRPPESKLLMIDNDEDTEETAILEVGANVEIGSIDVQKQFLRAKLESILSTVSTAEEIQVVNNTIDNLVPKLNVDKRETIVQVFKVEDVL